MLRYFLVGLGVLLIAGVDLTWAQQSPTQGVVWTPPSAVEEAARDLQRMREMGVDAVRTDIVENERLLEAADTLGIQLYQDVPIAHRSARGLDEAFSEASEQLADALRRAEAYGSARHFGLLQFSDTSDPAACTYIERLAEQIEEEGPDGSAAYYVTPFVEREQCAETADLVLLDARDSGAPVSRVDRWREMHETSVGWGALGTWVRPEAPSGFRVPHSSEYQARFFEDRLSAVQAQTADDVQAVFVYRWRDMLNSRTNPFGRAYGLHRGEDERRPAADVVEGFYTGQQTVFAFPPGEAPDRALSWLVLLGWGGIVLMGVVYAREPRVRRTVARYFRAHTFYRESIQEGREVLPGTTAVLLGIAAASIGVVVAAAAHHYQAAYTATLILQAFPDGLQASAASWLEAPIQLGLTAGVIYACAIGGWTLALMGGSRWWTRLSFSQTLMVVVWPRWPLLLATGAALIGATMGSAAGRSVVTVALIGTVGLGMSMTVRSLLDYAAIAEMPRSLAFAIGIVSPLALFVLVALALILQYDLSLALVWHLLTRS